MKKEIASGGSKSAVCQCSIKLDELKILLESMPKGTIANRYSAIKRLKEDRSSYNCPYSCESSEAIQTILNEILGPVKTTEPPSIFKRGMKKIREMTARTR